MYDIGIVGGGLAGLSSATLLARKGLKVILLEKNNFPQHKVCGEYISNETLPFFQKNLKLDPFEHGAVAIRNFETSAPSGKKLSMPLDLGGFGLSRYRLDHLLFEKASAENVQILTNTAVLDIETTDFGTKIRTAKDVFEAKMVIGAHGKRANVDNFLKRQFFAKNSPYVGVKYHIRTSEHDQQTIALHNFEDGYCGISRIEDGLFCLCYLVHREKLRLYKNIDHLEKQVLYKNPFLKRIFENSEKVFEVPKTVNEVSFRQKTVVENGILMCGDSAGMIAPLCGNGMAMALHGSWLLSELLGEYFEEKISKKQLFERYEANWKKQFGTRIAIGRRIQDFFGGVWLTEMLLSVALTFPLISKELMRFSHGQIFPNGSHSK